MPNLQTFLSHVRKTDSCWLWTACVNWKGYGLFRESRRTVSAHRFAYRHLKGSIPEGLTIDHLCGVKNCVNPDHLEAVTMRVNVLRGGNPASLNSRKITCVNGHDFTDTNTYHYFRAGHPARGCRTCYRNRARDLRRRNN